MAHHNEDHTFVLMAVLVMFIALMLFFFGIAFFEAIKGMGVV